MSIYAFEAYTTLKVYYAIEADTREQAEELFANFYEEHNDQVFDDLDHTENFESDYDIICKMGDGPMKQDKGDRSYRAEHINIDG